MPLRHKSIQRVKGRPHAQTSEDELLIRDSLRTSDAEVQVETRAIIQARIWSTIAEESGAAPITFVNDFDEEELPSDLPKDFDYVENKYI